MLPSGVKKYDIRLDPPPPFRWISFSGQHWSFWMALMDNYSSSYRIEQQRALGHDLSYSSLGHMEWAGNERNLIFLIWKFFPDLLKAWVKCVYMMGSGYLFYSFFWAHLCACTVGSYASYSVCDLTKIHTRQKVTRQKVILGNTKCLHLLFFFCMPELCYCHEAQNVIRVANKGRWAPFNVKLHFLFFNFYNLNEISKTNYKPF